MTLFFVCLILVLGANVSSGQRACVWTWIQPTTSDYVRSVGASGTISVQVNDDPVDGSRIKWIRDGTTVAEREYISATNSFDVITAHSRGSSSGTRTSTSLYDLTIDAFQLADNGAELQVDSEGCSIATTPSGKITFDVKYCDITHFAPTASSLNGTSTCGFNCIVEYTCNSSFALNNFTATCGESAEWSPSASLCNRTCDNLAFSPFAEPVDNNTIVSAGQDKTFSCTLCNGTFVRVCEETGEWNDTNPSCLSACSAGSIQCGTPVNNQPLCGGLQYEFDCNSSSDCPATFNLQCYSNGTWNSTDCDCPEVCSAGSIQCGTPVNNRTLCGGMQHEFNCIGNSDCHATFNLQCFSNGTWNSVDCNCLEAPALTNGQIAAIIVSAIFTVIFVILICYCCLKENCCLCLSESSICCCVWSENDDTCLCVCFGYDRQPCCCCCPCSKKDLLTCFKKILDTYIFGICIAISCLLTFAGIVLLVLPTECGSLNAKGIGGLFLTVLGLLLFITFLVIILIVKKIGENRPKNHSARTSENDSNRSDGKMTTAMTTTGGAPRKMEPAE